MKEKGMTVLLPNYNKKSNKGNISIDVSSTNFESFAKN